MGKIKIYLDNCCFNRPYDDQGQLKVELETKAKLFIQDLVLDGQIKLVWSYILDYENSKNLFSEKRDAIQRWKNLATLDTDETPGILETAALCKKFLGSADSLHLACAIHMGCDYFITVDKGILKHAGALRDPILICDPVTFLRIWEVGDDDRRGSSE